ncbi:NitT/TauT family transport system substrate-binding protein [Modicisalibacter ilicicola DSM 19980]|uniref:NitT/TauT family transport system substrate-binding protein n=1 Tax=Modicisalibacter ilicicola DSM 19980 TaxID=1121942 RepID=A0A1M4W6Z5_9GAMM|nr:ABC transporter substrate-binding protein [Halomonas ilicicola]SHE76977.1 NitT/TauT family transport system substrate-binding protein [Halomonas ilicicola DSM 19980]
MTIFDFPARNRLAAAVFCASFMTLPAMSPAQAKEPVNIGLNVSWPGFSFLEVARQKGLAEDYDLNLTIFEDPLGGHAALAAGQIDVYLSTAEYTPFAIERGTDTVLVSHLNISYGVDKILSARETDAQELKGKKVGAPQAYIGEILMGMWLDSEGLMPKDVDWVNLNADEAVGPVMSGDLAAAYMYEPWVTRVLENLDTATIVANTAEPRYLDTGIFMDAMYMNKNFIAERRQAAMDIIRARFDALQYWHDNTQEVNQLFSDYLQWPVSDIESVVGTNGKYLDDGLYMLDFDETARICGVLEGDPPHGIDNGSMVQSVRLTNEWWVKLGLMDAMQEAEKGVDCSLTADLVESGYRQSMSAR